MFNFQLQLSVSDRNLHVQSTRCGGHAGLGGILCTCKKIFSVPTNALLPGFNQRGHFSEWLRRAGSGADRSPTREGQ